MINIYSSIFLIITICGSHQSQFNYSKSNLSSLQNTIEHNYIKKDVSTLAPCDEEIFMIYLIDLQANSPESIINLSTLEEANELCRHVKRNLKSITGCLHNCKMMSQNEFYTRIIRGIRALEKKMCCNHEYKLKFSKYFKCYHELHFEYEVCEGPPYWIELLDKEKICNIYKDISDCFYVKTAKLCGKKSAKILKELINAVIDASIPMKCSKAKKTPNVPDAMPEKFATKPMYDSANKITCRS